MTFAALALLALVAGLAGTVWAVAPGTAQFVGRTRRRSRPPPSDFARRQLALNALNAFLIADAAPLGATSRPAIC